MRARSLLLTVACVWWVAGPILARAEPPGSRAGAEAPAAPARSAHRLAVELGFSHWFGDTFGAPDGFRTPMLSVGVRPGLPFLEVRLRYAVALAGLALPEGGDEVVGFASLELLATHGLAAGTQKLEVLAGPVATLAHAGGASGGLGLTVGTQWTFALTGELALGVFFEGRTLFYVLPGDSRDLLDDPRHDAQLDLGIVATLF